MLAIFFTAFASDDEEAFLPLYDGGSFRYLVVDFQELVLFGFGEVQVYFLVKVCQEGKLFS